MGLPDSRKEFLEQYITGTEYVVVGVKTTICCLTAYNGYEIIGTSACIDPKNFDREIGKRLAYERAIEEFNKFFGFLEQDREHLYHRTKLEG